MDANTLHAYLDSIMREAEERADAQKRRLDGVLAKARRAHVEAERRRRRQIASEEQARVIRDTEVRKGE